MSSARPFRAFVSYSHADAAFAAWLQRKLEGYRLPKRLADRVEPLPGQAPGRIGPVFRDRADLSAARDLSAAVRQGIAASSALVVVASPEAARSHWVALEIALFCELHPHAPILVALVRGESAEAVPEALRTGGAHPLAADFRKQGDGKRLAFLKIVAGLSDLPLDALVQRDAQRQVRRVTALTAAAAALVLVMGLLLGLALRARADSERRRADAEGLVEYMQTDLRDRLRGVGRLDIMAGVTKRIMAYYDGQAELPDDSLVRRARVLHSGGEDAEKAGDLTSARAMFTNAYGATSAVLARKPRDPNTIFAHAQSEFWIGELARRGGDRAAAARHWQAYRDRARDLAAAEPRSIRALTEQGYAEGNLCDLELIGNNNLSAAARHCEAAARYFKSVSAAAPGDPVVKRGLSNRLGWLARVQVAQGRYGAAMASRRAEAAILEELLQSDKGNAEYLTRRSWSDIGMAQILIEVGHPAEARGILKRRWAAYRPLMLAEQNSQYWETGIRIIRFLAKAERRMGVHSLSVKESEASEMIDRYLRMFPDREDELEALIKDIG